MIMQFTKDFVLNKQQLPLYYATIEATNIEASTYATTIEATTKYI